MDEKRCYRRNVFEQ